MPTTTTPRAPTSGTALLWFAAGLAAALALAALARGAALPAELWFDEIWSREFARTAGSPGQIFLGPRHHHDNNHKLNTLYLYFVPDGLPFAFYRLHSFAAGIAGVLLAARVAARRGLLEAWFAALLVAVNYWFVLCSAEARGYALALAFALLAFDGLRRYLDDRSRAGLVLFWLSVPLGFLAHLTFLHCYLAFVAWTYHRARPLGAAAALRHLAVCHALPGGFFVLLYLADVRGMEIGGGPPVPVHVVLGRLLSYGLGVPCASWPATGVALLAAAAFGYGLLLLRRAGSDSWVFFFTACVGSPLLVLALNPRFIYERYFFLPFLFFLLLLSDVLASLWRRSPAAKALVAAVLSAVVLGNLAEIRDFVTGGGRGAFAEALRHVAAADAESEITLTGDHDLRVAKMLAFYGPRVAPQRHFVYVNRAGRLREPAEWLLIHRPDRDFPPAELVRFPEDGGVLYRRDAAFCVTAFGGWDWYVYRRARPLSRRAAPSYNEEASRPELPRKAIRPPSQQPERWQGMASANVVELTAANWEQEVTRSDKPVLVDFWAVWCGPCRMLAPTIDKLADQFAGKVKVGKLNTDNSPDIAVRYGINSIPQVLLFKGGDQPLDKKVGVQPEAELVKMVNRVLEA